MERRTLIRLLVGLGIGIPIVVEGATFLGLVRSYVSGGEDRSTPTPSGPAVGIGDEVLPGTPQPETLTTAVVGTGVETWTLTLTVRVENTADEPYEFRLGTVVTETGDPVEGGATTGRIAPGGTGVATGRWDLPKGAVPRAVDAAGITFREGTTAAVRRRVPLASIPVEGG